MKTIVLGMLIALMVLAGATPAQSKGRPQMELVLVGVGSQRIVGLSGPTSRITVPASEYWKVTSIAGQLSTTAVVGNRVPIFNVYYPGDTNARRFFAPNAPTPASSFLHLQSGETDIAPFVLSAPVKYTQFAFEPFVIGPGWAIDAQDFNLIDGVADSWVLNVSYEIWTLASDVQHVAIDSGVPSSLQISAPTVEAIMARTP